MTSTTLIRLASTERRVRNVPVLLERRKTLIRQPAEPFAAGVLRGEVQPWAGKVVEVKS